VRLWLDQVQGFTGFPSLDVYEHVPAGLLNVRVADATTRAILNLVEPQQADYLVTEHPAYEGEFDDMAYRWDYNAWLPAFTQTALARKQLLAHLINTSDGVKPPADAAVKTVDKSEANGSGGPPEPFASAHHSRKCGSRSSHRSRDWWGRASTVGPHPSTPMARL